MQARKGPLINARLMVPASLECIHLAANPPEKKRSIPVLMVYLQHLKRGGDVLV